VAESDVCSLDATALAEAIRSRELSSLEVVAAHLARIEERNPELNAVVTLAPDARDRARERDAAIAGGEGGIGALHGVPFTVKDTLDTAGLRTTRGSLLYAEHVPVADATAVARMTQAGGVLLGKTNTPELALWWETDNLVFGLTRNPRDPARTAGGSSGGEAAAIASGMSPVGLGSDVGGSIRHPAHCCGIVGLKPTHGRVPLTGHFPEVLLGVMHVGPLARSVRDAALALGVLAGPDGRDPYALPVPLDLDAASRALRIGVVPDGGAAPVAAEVEAVVRSAAGALAASGCEVAEVRVAALAEHDWNALTMVLYGVESGEEVQRIVAGREQELHPRLQRRLAASGGTLAEYTAARDAWEALRRDTVRALVDVDVLLGPCAPVAAFAHGADELEVDGVAVPPRHVLQATIPWDLTGSPALAVPFGTSADGLPIDVQLVGRHFDEAALFRAGALLEQARPR
jgi:aspartyl-tRNA(Asn)/glutamyl-tRNA(Gln) amidotransferase subunit A